MQIGGYWFERRFLALILLLLLVVATAVVLFQRGGESSSDTREERGVGVVPELTPSEALPPEGIAANASLSGQVKLRPPCPPRRECPHRPLAGADVVVIGPHGTQRTTTGGGGRFSLQVPAGRYRLEASYGQLSVRRQVLAVDGESVTVEVILQAR